MPLDSEGNYSLPPAPTFPAVGGQTIQSAHFNTIMYDMQDAFNAMLRASGLKSMAGELKMNENKITGLKDATARGDAVNLGTLVKRGVFSSAFVANVSHAASPLVLEVVTGMNLTEYVQGVTIVTRLQDVTANPVMSSEIKFKLDGLPVIDLMSGSGFTDATLDDLGVSSQAMFMIDFITGFGTSRFVARQVYNANIPIKKAEGNVTVSSATTLGISQYLRFGYPVDSVHFPTVTDVGELYSNAIRRNVTVVGGGPYAFGAIHGRGLYVLEGATGITGACGIFCEPGFGSVSFTGTLSGIHFASTLTLSGGTATLSKVF